MSSGMIETLVGALIAHAGCEDQLALVLKLLGSSLPLPAVQDHVHVADTIKRRLVQRGKTTEAVKFAELFRRFNSSPYPKNKWAPLCLLLSLRDSARVPGAVNVYAPSMAKTLRADDTETQKQSARIGARLVDALHDATTADSNSAAVASSQAIGTSASLIGHQNGDEIENRLAWLAKYRAQENPNTLATSVVPEQELLRDLVFVIQGIDGRRIKFDNVADTFVVDVQSNVPLSTRDFIGRIAELGWLYRHISHFLQERSSESSLSLTGQAFCTALKDELTEYYRLVAVLEGHLVQDAHQDVPSVLTIRRLLVWTADPLQRLRILASLVDQVGDKKGGELASAVHAFVKHGDPVVSRTVQYVLQKVARPIYFMVRRWVFAGELDDRFGEFFIAVDLEVSVDAWWTGKYTLREEMVPSFISRALANKILLIGKSIDFIRHVCRDTADVFDPLSIRSETSNYFENTEDLLVDGGSPALTRAIDSAYQVTSARLLDVMRTKYRLLDHFGALKRYLLLGQGDFILHLMDVLVDDLSKPSSSLFLHNLTGSLETAIRATTAQYEDTELIERVDVRLLEASPGDMGWDVFTLDYHVGAPINAVLTPTCMQQYLRIFNFLWRLKRMDHFLTGTWKHMTIHHRTFAAFPELRPLLMQCSLMGSQMLHFINQFQYYVVFEVLECSWTEMEEEIKVIPDFDRLIVAHQHFLDSVCARALLNEDSRAIHGKVRSIFNLIQQFQEALNALISSASDQVASQMDVRTRAHSRTQAGKWAVTEEESKNTARQRKLYVEGPLKQSSLQLRAIHESFHDMVSRFLSDLSAHADPSLRFLCFRLDFNEFYRRA